MDGWTTPPQGFKLEPLPYGLNHVNGVPVETLSAHDDRLGGGEEALAKQIEAIARERGAHTVYLSALNVRHIPQVSFSGYSLGSVLPPPASTPIYLTQHYCYAAFLCNAPAGEEIHQFDAPVIGYRAFNWKGGPLLGIGFGVPWPITKEPQCAKCEKEAHASAWGENSLWSNPLTKRPSHDAPDEGCSCGIYAHKAPERLYLGPINAVVIGYGKVIVHPDGWRAEKVEIVGLKAYKEEDEGPSSMFAFLKAEKGHPEWWNSKPPSPGALEILAEQYGTRIIENWDHGVVLAEELGAQKISEEIHSRAASR